MTGVTEGASGTTFAADGPCQIRLAGASIEEWAASKQTRGRPLVWTLPGTLAPGLFWTMHVWAGKDGEGELSVSVAYPVFEGIDLDDNAAVIAAALDAVDSALDGALRNAAKVDVEIRQRGRR